VAFIAAVLVAALFVACGGSSSDSSSTASSDAGGSTAAGTTAQDGSQGGSAKSSPGQRGSQSQDDGQAQSNGQGSQRQEAQQDGGGDGRNIALAPLAVSGGGAEQFRSKGADNSIQEFGAEGSESELQQAAEAVYGFLSSRAREEWDVACSYLAKSNIEQLEQLGSQAPQFRNAGCAAILEAFTRRLPAAAERVVTTVDAGSLRREGERGFLMYYGADRAQYAMPLVSEGGSWKVAALSPTTLG
jgi:hypothetical protein